MAILSVKNLSISFPIDKQYYQAVDRISFSLSEGKILGIVGESGCGKSLTALSIIKLLPPKALLTADQICFNGTDILAADEHRMRELRGNDISMIFQEPMTSLNPLIKVGKQIAETVTLHQKTNNAAEEALEIMKQVGLNNVEDLYNQYPHQLSGGMRQRIMIAMAMVLKPRLLIADEPTTALDVTIQAQILDLMKQLNRKFGTAIIFISHDLGVIRQMCDEVIVMYMGNIIEVAGTEELLFNPQHPYTIGLLAAIPNPSRKKKSLFTIAGRVPGITERPAGCSFATRCGFVTEPCLRSKPPLVYQQSHGVSCFNYQDIKREIKDV